VAETPARGEGGPRRLDAVDPWAKDVLGLDKTFLERLLALAKSTGESGRTRRSRLPRALSLAPDRTDLADAIHQVAATQPADSAQPKDLLADVSEEWIRAHDAAPGTWETRARLERENYVTETDAGYAVLVRAGEAMEQMNAFYRRFFRYGTEEDGRKVPRIALHLFKDHKEYLKLGKGPPIEWSGGQFTGDSVETDAGGGFDGMVGTLFHEAAHQFVGLATTAAGVNRGSRPTSRGPSSRQDRDHEPANHRLFTRLEDGEGVDVVGFGRDRPGPSSDPRKAPVRIVLERGTRGGLPGTRPPGASSTSCGTNRTPRTVVSLPRRVPSVRERPAEVSRRVRPSRRWSSAIRSRRRRACQARQPAAPPEVDEMDAVWKDWLTDLRDEQIGRKKVERPWLAWARHAITRKDFDDATELFERGLERTPFDPDLLLEFAEHLVARSRNKDRACKLAEQALRALEAATPQDARRISAVEGRLSEWDPSRASLERTHRELFAAALSIARRYVDAKRPLLTMHVARTFGGDLGVPGLDALYEDAVRTSGKTLALWQLAYDERSLRGWAPDPGKVFTPYGTILKSRLGTYEPELYDFHILQCDTVTSATSRWRRSSTRRRAERLLRPRLRPEERDPLRGAGSTSPRSSTPARRRSGGTTRDHLGHRWRRLASTSRVGGGRVGDGEPVSSRTSATRRAPQRLRPPDRRRRRRVRAVRTLSRARTTWRPHRARARVARAKRPASRLTARTWAWSLPSPSSKGGSRAARALRRPRPRPDAARLWCARRRRDPDRRVACRPRRASRGRGPRVISVLRTGTPRRSRRRRRPSSGRRGPRPLREGQDALREHVRRVLHREALQAPRLLLDRRARRREGAGFSLGEPWKPGEASYLDTPRGLEQQRNVVALRTWLVMWGRGGRATVSGGASTRSSDGASRSRRRCRATWSPRSRGPRHG
jgi:hypothetical protein